MGIMDDFVLHFEKLPREGKAWTKDTMVRIGTAARTLSWLRIFRAGKSELDRDVPTLRIFKRLHNLEGKLDQPFLYDSQLLKRIESLEKAAGRKKL